MLSALSKKRRFSFETTDPFYPDYLSVYVVNVIETESEFKMSMKSLSSYKVIAGKLGSNLAAQFQKLFIFFVTKSEQRG